jgi:uncharacterized membrane protein YhfC
LGAFVRLLNALLMMATPLALGAYLARKQGGRWRFFVAGGVTFVASQIFHLPFNSRLLVPLLEDLGWMGALAPPRQIGLALALGLSAGIFEQLARYLTLRWWRRDLRSWAQGLMFGAGHGGTEAILLGLVALNTFLRALAFRDSGLSGVVPAEALEAAQAHLEAYWALPWYAALLGSVERVFALVFHIAAALLVLQVFTRGGLCWLAAAVLWHTLTDAAAVFTAANWGIYPAELALLVVAGLSAIVIWRLRTQAGDPVRRAVPHLTPPADFDPERDKGPDPGDLEESRYVE